MTSALHTLAERETHACGCDISPRFTIQTLVKLASGDWLIGDNVMCSLYLHFGDFDSSG